MGPDDSRSHVEGNWRHLKSTQNLDGTQFGISDQLCCRVGALGLLPSREYKYGSQREDLEAEPFRVRCPHNGGVVNGWMANLIIEPVFLDAKPRYPSPAATLP